MESSCRFALRRDPWGGTLICHKCRSCLRMVTVRLRVYWMRSQVERAFLAQEGADGGLSHIPSCKAFLASRRTGFYLRVLREGLVKAGGAIARLGRDAHRITVADVTRVYAFEKNDGATLPRVMQVDALSEAWRDHFRRQLAKVAP
jgi:3-alpha domain